MGSGVLPLLAAPPGGAASGAGRGGRWLAEAAPPPRHGAAGFNFTNIHEIGGVHE